MGNGIGTADFFRAVDDSDLDMYEVRFLMRVWRRGTCWEKLQNISDATGMSIGKASQVRKALLAKGWLKEIAADGRVAYQVAIPAVTEDSTTESIVVEVHDVKPEFHEVKSIVVEVHEVEAEFHQVKPEFHVVHALPINRQNEDHTIKFKSAPAPTAAPPSPSTDPELIAAREATFTLIAFWEELTKRRRPGNDDQFREKWVEPFNQIWIMCGRSLDTAKAKVQAVRDSILAGGGRIFDPSKLPAHVQALVDAELLPMTAALNGSNGNGYRPNFRNDPEAREAHNRKVMAEVAADLANGGWSQWTPQGT
jgi:hypothetical protein